MSQRKKIKEAKKKEKERSSKIFLFFCDAVLGKMKTKA